jgi:hypothetical protein
MSSTTETAQVRLERITPSHCRVVLDNPPVNLMGPEFVVQIREIITALVSKRGVSSRSGLPEALSKWSDQATPA